MKQTKQSTSVRKLQKAIDAYFADCAQTGEPGSMTGLCIALGMTAQALEVLREQSAACSDVIDMAQLRVEHAYEKRLIQRGNSGDVFALKNFGWRDKKEFAHTGQLQVQLSDEVKEWSK